MPSGALSARLVTRSTRYTWTGRFPAAATYFSNPRACTGRFNYLRLLLLNEHPNRLLNQTPILRDPIYRGRPTNPGQANSGFLYNH